ncbi:MAG: alpha/beta fold hydrolase [Actinomycetota bacterium]|nr:alpha/beta hydrolase [Actinomycetota bacterium]
MINLTEVAAGAGERVIFVHGTPGWGSDTFPDQLQLADSFEVHLIDRRGYPDNPASDRVGFDVDTEDILGLLGDGAHLVGQSYGGVGCLLAAASAPEKIQSLTVIEPAAYSIARGEPATEELIRRLESMLYARAHDTVMDAYRAYAESFGMTLPDDLTLTERELRSIQPIMIERPAWEADIPLERLRGLPIAIVSGTYGENSDSLRARARHAICAALVRELNAKEVVLEGGGHNPQIEVSEAFNKWLRSFLNRAGVGESPRDRRSRF